MADQRLELAADCRQIALGAHHGADVAVGARSFVDKPVGPARFEAHALQLGEEALGVVALDSLAQRGASFPSSGAAARYSKRSDGARFRVMAWATSPRSQGVRA